MVVSIIFYIFGLFELITNTVYLLKKDGIRQAYGQHREIPAWVSCDRMKVKVITMLVVGIAMTASLLLLLTGKANLAATVQKIVVCSYALYTIGEAAAYRTHKLGWALAVLVVCLGILYFV